MIIVTGILIIAFAVFVIDYIALDIAEKSAEEQERQNRKLGNK